MMAGRGGRQGRRDHPHHVAFLVTRGSAESLVLVVRLQHAPDRRPSPRAPSQQARANVQQLVSELSMSAASVYRTTTPRTRNFSSRIRTSGPKRLRISLMVAGPPLSALKRMSSTVISATFFRRKPGAQVHEAFSFRLSCDDTGVPEHHALNVAIVIIFNISGWPSTLRFRPDQRRRNRLLPCRHPKRES